MEIQEQLKKLREEGKKVLVLRIKQKYLTAILQGRKVQEEREIRPNNEAKYVQLDNEGYALTDENENSLPVHYDYIYFYVGNDPDCDRAIVEVTDAHTEVCVDDNGEIISYPITKNGVECVFEVEVIVYDLGAIIAKYTATKHRR